MIEVRMTAEEIASFPDRYAIVKEFRRRAWGQCPGALHLMMSDSRPDDDGETTVWRVTKA